MSCNHRRPLLKVLCLDRIDVLISEIALLTLRWQFVYLKILSETGPYKLHTWPRSHTWYTRSHTWYNQQVHIMVQNSCMKYPWNMFNSLRPSDAFMRHETKLALVQIMACRLAGASHYLKQCGTMWIGPWGTNFNNILVKMHHFHSRKCVWICRLQKEYDEALKWRVLILLP